jgi:hypothetical protein
MNTFMNLDDLEAPPLLSHASAVWPEEPQCMAGDDARLSIVLDISASL